MHWADDKRCHQENVDAEQLHNHELSWLFILYVMLLPIEILQSIKGIYFIIMSPLLTGDMVTIWERFQYKEAISPE